MQQVIVKKKKETVIFDTDEGPRPGTTAESIAKLRPAFKKDGIVTAANSSGINDGAAAVVVMSEEKAKELGVTPMATFVAGALGGVDPSIMGVGPVASTKKVMAKTGYKIEDFDIIEANEAFAAQSIAVQKELGFTDEQAYSQFGFLLDAFKYGVPPHAGLAYGLDRLVMLMAKQDSIRDVIAFPKIKDASCLMTEAPTPADTKQLEELGLEVVTEEK